MVREATNQGGALAKVDHSLVRERYNNNGKQWASGYGMNTNKGEKVLMIG